MVRRHSTGYPQLQGHCSQHCPKHQQLGEDELMDLPLITQSIKRRHHACADMFLLRKKYLSTRLAVESLYGLRDLMDNSFYRIYYLIYIRIINRIFYIIFYRIINNNIYNILNKIIN